MPLPLPNLDDRKWSDLVEEGRALIPFYAPEWTDHNIHDPGITLMELFAWLAEMDIYQLNRIPDRHRLKFLALAGIYPKPPLASRTVVSVSLAAGIPKLELPSSLVLEGTDPFGEATRFLTQEAITVVPSDLEAIQFHDGTDLRQFKQKEGQWSDISIFGAVPRAESDAYFGFSRDLFGFGNIQLYFKIAGERKDWRERLRIIEEAEPRRPAPSNYGCSQQSNKNRISSDAQVPLFQPLKHHSVQTVWQFHPEGAGPDDWETLIPERDEVFDDTRAFTLGGKVVLKPPKIMQAEKLGNVQKQLYYVRCHFQSGAYDAAPVIQTILMNAVPAEQAVPVGDWKLTISSDAVITGEEPRRGQMTRLHLQFNSLNLKGDSEILQQCTEALEKGAGWNTAKFMECLSKKKPHGIVQRLSFEPQAPDLPEMRVLEYEPPQNGRVGLIILEVEVLGTGNGRPHQQFQLTQNPVFREQCIVLTLEKESEKEKSLWYGWRTWHGQPDLDASGRRDLHHTLEPSEGIIQFGDGEHGRVPPEGSWILAVYRETRAEGGNLAAGRVNRLSDCLHNRAVLENYDEARSAIEKITNLLPAEGGMQAESLVHAQGRAVEMAEKTCRAVTIEDIEKLAMETPGVELARASARPNVFVPLPCLKAPGMVSVVVIPNLPVPKPVPAPELLAAVEAHLHRHRIIGMRLDVVGPSFKEVSIEAEVVSFRGVDKSKLRSTIELALEAFLDPRTGGPDRRGWPFGRDVYRSEILQLIDEIEGVDHVQSLALVGSGDEPQCGNVALCPTELVTTGLHKIEVLR